MNSVIEIGTVLAVDANSVLLETINRSACAQCSAKSTCGQSTLGSWMETSNQLLIQRPEENLQLGDRVEIRLEGDVLAKAALVVYVIPLLALLLGTLAANALVSTDLSAFLGAALGLAGGLILVSVLTKNWTNKAALTPVFHQLISTKSLN